MEKEASVLRVQESFLIFNLLVKEGMNMCSSEAEGEACSSFGFSLAGVSYKPIQVKG